MGGDRKAQEVKVSTTSGGFYFLAMLGSATYFLRQADDIGDGIWGIVRALAWPATFAYEVLGQLGA